MDPDPSGLRRPRHDGPPVRILFAVLGIALWMLTQARLAGIFLLLVDGLAAHALSGFCATIILWPFWRGFTTPRSLIGFRSSTRVLAASAALLAPFATVALVTRPVWSAPSATAWLGTAGVLLLLAAAEEIVCRGFLLDLLSFGGRTAYGVALSSAAFAGLHLWNDSVTAAGIANIFLAGILFGLVKLSTGGLLWPTALHWFWNLFTGMIFGWSVSGHQPLPTLFTCAGTPPWGAFGPEESILMTIGLVLGIVLETVQLRNSPGRISGHPSPAESDGRRGGPSTSRIPPGS